MIINSISNKKIKDIEKLKDNRNIKKYKKYVVEGYHLVEEAMLANVVEEIFLLEGKEGVNINNKNIKITLVNKQVMNFLTDTVTSQGIVAVCSIDDKELDVNKYNHVLMLDRIQDPGNLGTIIRSADAFGVDCVILGKGTTSIYGQKVMRSMQGSNFHIDCYENIDLLNVIDEMNSFDIYATSLKASNYLEDINNYNEKIAVVLGNEGSGVSNELLEKVNNLLKIRMTGRAESLNVAISAGIIMYYMFEKGK